MTAPPPCSGEAGVAAEAARLVEATRLFTVGQTVVRALDGVTVGFARRTFTAVMGPSGSGKSTLLHCVAGLESLTSGRALVGGVDLGTLDDRRLTQLRRDRIGIVFQAFNLIPGFDVADNIRLPLILAGRGCDAGWFDAVVGVLGIGDRMGHMPAQLSGGEQQRVAVARALITRPELIVADEPTGNLDRATGDEVLGLLRRAVDELGQTVVMVTHDLHAAARADRVVAMLDGRLAQGAGADAAEGPAR